MIVVKDIEYFDTEKYEDRVEILNYKPLPNFFKFVKPEEKVSQEFIEREVVEGTRFRCQGQDVVIGWCKKAQDVLGLPFKVFKNMEYWYKQDAKDMRFRFEKEENKWRKEKRQLVFYRNLSYLVVFVSWLIFNLT